MAAEGSNGEHVKRSGFRKLTLEEAREKGLKRRFGLSRGRIDSGAKRPLESHPTIPAASAKSAFKPRNAKTRLRAKPDPEMQAVAALVRERDHNLCQWPLGCRTGDDRIDVHHIAKRSQRPDLKYDPGNLVCLCRTHHEYTDAHRSEALDLGMLSDATYERAAKG